MHGIQPTVCLSTCGDGKKASNEQCDDGNTNNGDGCSSTCTTEFGFTCTGTQPSSCSTSCGDGKKASTEACDDGNATANDGCTNCAVNFGYSCSGTQPSACTNVCGSTCDATHSSGATCGTGKCVYTGCSTGFANCDTSGTDTNGCETATNTPTKCGGCSNVCTATNATNPLCTSGTTCTYTCNSGFADCVTTAPNLNGCETSITTRAHCGGCSTACGSTQLCSASACITAPAPVIATKWGDPTGWKDGSNNTIQMTFNSTGVAGTIYQCRTGPASSFTSTTPAWVNCDGGSGTTPTYKPAPTPAASDPDVQGGSYHTEYRYISDTYTSPAATYDYYIHHSLDGVPTCPRAANDHPLFSDTALFAAAKAFNTASSANAALFPLTKLFANTGTVKLKNPFIEIPFTSVSASRGMIAGFWTLPLPNPEIVDDVSLRHRYVLSADGTMILKKRAFLSQKTNDCTDEYHFNSNYYGRVTITCDAFVLNATGQGVCINSVGGTATVTKFDLYPTNSAYVSVAGWQKILRRHPDMCVGSATCNDLYPFMIALPP